MAKPNYVTLYCCLDTGFIQCIGVYENWKTACGDGLLYLTDLISEREREDAIENVGRKYTLSQLYRTEGETGYGLSILVNGEDSGEYVLMLDIDGEPDEKEREDDKDV